MVQQRLKKAILGVGLDNDDGHVRLTSGRNFCLVGGSRGTHELMQEKCIKLNEKLDTRGKQLEDLEKDEFLDLARECDMNMVTPPKGDERQPR